MFSTDYHDCYERLNSSPDVGWDEFHNNYRKLVQTWHPDRYEGSHPQLAETTFIELTQAFNRIRDYYRKYNHLPQTQLARQGSQITGSEKSDLGELDAQGGLGNSHWRRPMHQKIPNWRQSLQIFAIALLGLGLLMLLRSMDNQSRQKLVHEGRVVQTTESDAEEMPTSIGTPLIQVNKPGR